MRSWQLIKKYTMTFGSFPIMGKDSIKRDIRPAIYLKSRDVDILKQINKMHGSVIITQYGEFGDVLQGPESYEKHD
jgi:hypothetical protein